MQYLYKAVNLIKNNIIAYFLFILIIFIPFAFEAVEYIYNNKTLPFLLVNMVFSALLFFFDAGIYYLILENIGSQKSMFLELYQSSKKYFLRVLVVTICMGIVFVVIFYVSSKFFKGFTLSDIPAKVFQKSMPGSILRNIVGFFVSVFFVYALPSIYINDSTAIRAMQISFVFLKSHFKESLPLIYLLVISAVINILIGQIAFKHEYQSVVYWFIMAGVSFCVYTIELLVFLMAALIYKDCNE